MNKAYLLRPLSLLTQKGDLSIYKKESNMNIEKRLIDIESNLTKLRKLDKSYEVFGSDSHKYHSTKVGESEILSFEQRIGTELPTEFRQFLLKIGYGAGPDYGIFNLDKMIKEYEEWKSCLDERGAFDKAFELTNADANELIEKKKDDMKGFYYKRLKTANGLLPIMTEGCTYFAYIVLNGEQKGKIWGLDINEFDTLPSGVTEEFGFLTWYEAWLKKANTKIGEKSKGGIIGKIITKITKKAL
jgi:SMI1 / KNR4 family (SUKH-1)